MVDVENEQMPLFTYLAVYLLLEEDQRQDITWPAQEYLFDPLFWFLRNKQYSDE